MKVTRKASRWGNWIIAFGCLAFFALYWYLLLVPVQDSYVTRNLLNHTANHPSWVLFALIALLDGFLFGATTMIGFNVGKPRFFGIDYPNGLHLADIIESKSFWIWCAVSVALFELFTMLWIGGI